MSEIDRDAFLELLDKLLSDSDEEVLASARAIRQQMTEAEVSWDLLLVQAPGDEDEHHHDDDDDDDEDEADDHAADLSRTAGSTKDDLAMIEDLVAKYEISDATKEELEEYKADIEEGDFSEADHKYLQALYQRVTGKKR